MSTKELILKRFAELDQQARALKLLPPDSSGMSYYIPEEFLAWGTSVLNLLQGASGGDSVHFINFKKIYDNGWGGGQSQIGAARGVFAAAKADYEGGYVFNLEARISGEIFGDLVTLAKEALNNDNDKAAAVLACAALEDALKRFCAHERNRRRRKGNARHRECIEGRRSGDRGPEDSPRRHAEDSQLRHARELGEDHSARYQQRHRLRGGVSSRVLLTQIDASDRYQHHLSRPMLRGAGCARPFPKPLRKRD
jgi:hypothetical protein